MRHGAGLALAGDGGLLIEELPCKDKCKVGELPPPVTPWMPRSSVFEGRDHATRGCSEPDKADNRVAMTLPIMIASLVTPTWSR